MNTVHVIQTVVMYNLQVSFDICFFFKKKLNNFHGGLKGSAGRVAIAGNSWSCDARAANAGNNWVRIFKPTNPSKLFSLCFIFYIVTHHTQQLRVHRHQ